MRLKTVSRYPPYISATQLTAYSMCPLMHYILYQLRPPKEPSKFLAEGAVVHEMLFHVHETGATSVEQILTPEIQDTFMEIAREHGMEEEVALEMIERATDTAQKYWDALSRHGITPYRSEAIVRLILPDVSLLSILDIVGRGSIKVGGIRKTVLSIIDWKTGTRAKSKIDALSSIQLMFYQFLMNAVLLTAYGRVPGFFLPSDQADFTIPGDKLEDVRKSLPKKFTPEELLRSLRIHMGDLYEFSIRTTGLPGILKATYEKPRSSRDITFDIVYAEPRYTPEPLEDAEAIRDTTNVAIAVPSMELGLKKAPIEIHAGFISSPNYSNRNRPPSYVTVPATRDRLLIIGHLISSLAEAQATGRFYPTGAACYRCYPEICTRLMEGDDPEKIWLELHPPEDAGSFA